MSGNNRSVWFDHFYRGIRYFSRNPWMKAQLMVEIKKAAREQREFTQEEADELMIMAFPSEKENIEREKIGRD